MSLKVILIRHGKAESASEGVDDLHRQLTREGALALAHAFPRAIALLDLPERTECWCSAAVRERLCGVSLDFQPGAICAIDIFEDAQRHIGHATRPVGRLAWFVQGPVVEG